MLKVTELGDNAVSFEADRTLTHDDYQNVLIPKLDELIESHGKVRILFFMGENFHGWEPAAMWDDAKFGIQHRKDIEKCAVVGGPEWMEWATMIGALLIHGEVKTFPTDQLMHAKNWIKLPLQAPAK